MSSYEYTGRLRIVGQMIAFGVIFATSQLFIGESSRHGLGRALLATAVSATIYGVGFTLWTRASHRRRARRMYAGDPHLVAPQPDGPWDFRLQASLMEARRVKSWPIVGHLYISRDLVSFVPLLNTSERYRQPFTMPLQNTPHVDVTDRSEDWLTSLLSGRAPRYVEIWNGERCLLFSVPEPDRVAESLRDYWRHADINRR